MNIQKFYNQHKLTVITVVYWILLTYIISALIWWFVELLQQNNEMYQFQFELIKPDDPNQTQKKSFILAEKERNIAQYLGEGITFFALIVLGAIFVYRAVRQQIKLNEQQQNFMMAVTHELKTPIAITRLNLETLEKRKLDEEVRQKLINTAIAETSRLNDLCDNILLASNIDTGKYLINNEVIDLSSLLNQALEYLHSRFPKRILNHSIQDNIEMVADSFLIQLMIHNLIENAFKYSPSDKEVDVRLYTQGEKIVFEVKDFGKGIDEKERGKIFQKFYRTGDESTRSTKGTGLGLFLTKKIVLDHNGEIKVKPNDPMGSIFEVRFQLFKGSNHEC